MNINCNDIFLKLILNILRSNNKTNLSTMWKDS
jgi:hypothetical protein